MGITEEMALDTKVSRLGEIAVDLRKKVTQLEEQIRPNTPPEVLEKRGQTTIEAVKKIAEAEEICAKAVDQVSQTWEALMGDVQSLRLQMN